MKHLFFILLSFVFIPSISANSGDDFKVRFLHPHSGLPALVAFNPESNNRPQAENFAWWMKQNMLANGAFQLIPYRSVAGENGYQHIHFQQMYGRFPVEAGQVSLHQKNNKTVSISGLYFPQLELDTAVHISAGEAIKQALRVFDQALFMWEIPREEKILQELKGRNATYYPQPQLCIIALNDSFRNADFKLAYKIDVYAASPLQREWVYIDAQSGELLDRENRICEVEKEGIAHTKYAGIRAIHCDSIGLDSFILKETVHGSGIHTIDVRIIDLDSSREFYDSDNIWNNKNSARDEVATDVHWGSAMFYEYFSNYHGRSSYDDSDGFIFSKVHVGTNYNNAFWSGNTAHYGDGDGIKYGPLTSIDVVAHELTHGVTQYSAGLRYRNESGALNESFSDIFGKTIEFKADSAKFSWEMARRFMLFNSKPFRDMSFPPNQNHPKYYFGQFYYSGPLDNGGVHTNSGVQNYWFYLLCHGGSGFRESDSMPFTVKPIGMDAAAKIAYQNLNAYLYREAAFIEACFYSIEAAIELFGNQSLEHIQVQNAWYAVGLLNQGDLSVDQTHALPGRWTVYPNPGQSHIQIHHPSVFDRQDVEILDISGKSIHSTTLLPGENLDVSELSQGIYFIRIDNVVLKWVKA